MTIISGCLLAFDGFVLNFTFLFNPHLLQADQIGDLSQKGEHRTVQVAVLAQIHLLAASTFQLDDRPNAPL